MTRQNDARGFCEDRPTLERELGIGSSSSAILRVYDCHFRAADNRSGIDSLCGKHFFFSVLFSVPSFLRFDAGVLINRAIALSARPATLGHHSKRSNCPVPEKIARHLLWPTAGAVSCLAFGGRARVCQPAHGLISKTRKNTNERETRVCPTQPNKCSSGCSGASPQGSRPRPE